MKEKIPYGTKFPVTMTLAERDLIMEHTFCDPHFVDLAEVKPAYCMSLLLQRRISPHLLRCTPSASSTYCQVRFRGRSVVTPYIYENLRRFAT